MARLPVVPDLGAFLREQRLASRLSLRQLAERAGVSNPYLSQIERGLRTPSAQILSALADALDLSADSLYQRAGIRVPAAGGAGVVAAIEDDQALSQRQRRALVDLYLLFVADPREGPDGAVEPGPGVLDASTPDSSPSDAPQARAAPGSERPRGDLPSPLPDVEGVRPERDAPSEVVSLATVVALKPATQVLGTPEDPWPYDLLDVDPAPLPARDRVNATEARLRVLVTAVESSVTDHPAPTTEENP